jgi:hypothetical protein
MHKVRLAGKVETLFYKATNDPTTLENMRTMGTDSLACGNYHFSFFHTTHFTPSHFSLPGHHFAVYTVELNVTYTEDGVLT